MPDQVKAPGQAIHRLISIAALISFSGALLIAGCGGAPGVKVVNDLEFEVALIRCESRSISGADPIFIGEGKEKTIHPGLTCSVTGPTSRSGPFGAIHDEGPYIGCLRMPIYSERSGVKVYVSDLERDVGFTECDRAGVP